MNKPNPGSPEAKAQGCKCPVIDNGHGSGAFIDPDSGDPLFWINSACPLHGVREDQ